MTGNGASAIRVDRDIVFGRGGELDLKLDVYHPSGEQARRTAVIQLHGGGFARGAKENIANNCRLFAERGYVAIASQYRLVDQAQWPAQIHDVKAAIRWTRANASQFGVDPEKIAVAGYSAGALLSLVAAGSGDQPEMEGEGGTPDASSAVAACIAFYPPLERSRPADEAGARLISSGSSDAVYEEASPITYARAGMPPTVILHSTGDTTLPVEGSLRLFESLRAAGVPAEIHVFDGLSHVFDRHPEFAEPSIEVCHLFLDRHVVEPRVYPPFVAGAARPG